ncbi:MAG TPA: glycogen-binding domain-containing protein [Gemmatimonadales bacterium]|nr:glycogen-binding domain-containing protein [Gemmatimonadales bacterium]
MSLARGALVALVCSAWWAMPAGAQLAGTLDMGAGTYRPDRAIPGGIASIAPALRFREGPLELNALGVYSDAPAGRWNFQGGTEAFVRTPALGILQLEAMGRVEWTSHYQARGTTILSGGVRAYLATGARARAWIGRSFGQATSLGARRPLRRSEVGGSTTLGAVHLEFTLANTTVDRSFMLGPVDPREGTDTLSAYPSPAGQRRVDRVALTDAVLSGRWRFRSIDFDAAFGRRFSRLTPETTIWGLSASRDLSPTLAVVGAAGRAGSDPVTSVPGARYFALGLRLKVGPPLATPPPTLETTTEAAPFRIGPAVAAGREIVVQAPDARSVELAGDFTDWKPVALRPWGEDAWRTLLPVPPGLHRLAVRIDGGEWQAPPGTRAIESEFGGEVAEVVVE